ncbi:MAG: NAD(+) synthase [Bacilli bacterium]|nr:NAD(+) synthase [Bacilli bacterium]
MKTCEKKIKEYAEKIIFFLKKYILVNKLNGFVLGLSGGVDSAVTLLLLLKTIEKNKIHVLILPCESGKKDEEYAKQLCDKFDIKYKIIDLTPIYRTTIQNIEKSFLLSQKTKNNIKARLRMCTLYAIAQEKKSLVVGTSNLDEIYTGFFTKFGDSACDILPLSQLTKTEIYSLAKMLGVTEEIIKRKPSSGLNKNANDENELGTTYKNIDNFLNGKKINNKAKKRINYLHKISEHKRKPIPKPPAFKR